MKINLAIAHNFALIRRVKETFFVKKKHLGPGVLCKVSCLHEFVLEGTYYQ